MKRVIRRGIFETNSSSSHSVSIIRPGREIPKDVSEDHDHGLTVNDLKEPRDLMVDSETNKVKVYLGEFGWGPEAYNSMYAKLSYLLTLVACTNNTAFNEEAFYDLEDIRRINDVIKDRYSCDGIEIANKLVFSEEYGGISRYNTIPYFYVDHQSLCSLNNFLDEYSISIEDFIFDKNIVLFILNDNNDYFTKAQNELFKHQLANQDLYEEDYIGEERIEIE